LQQRNKPVVWTMHDCWAFTGHCAYFDYAGCSKWKTGCSHCPEKHHYPISLLLDNSVRNYADKKRLFTKVQNMVLVSPSQWLKDLLAESFLKKYPAKVINNGVNLEVFTPRSDAANRSLRERFELGGRFVVLAVASVWDERKGYPAILQLADRLQPDEVLVIVGLNKYQKRAIPKNVIGITRTNNIQELADLYSAADVFINPTLDDNFPTTNIEALACGTPVITYRTGGSIESVDPSTGLIADKGDINDLLRQIEAIRSQGKPFYTEACRSKAVAHYERGAKFQEYIDLYLSMLSAPEPMKKERPSE
jgi:putative colanic acid biosynthesis glycosyltransferase